MPLPASPSSRPTARRSSPPSTTSLCRSPSKAWRRAARQQPLIIADKRGAKGKLPDTVRW